MAEGNVPETKEIEEGKIFAVISYIWILCIITLLLKKDNKFAFFHAKQGLVLFIIAIINACISMFIPLISWFVTLPIALCLLICSIFGIIQSLMGKYAKIPVISDLADKISL